MRSELFAVPLETHSLALNQIAELPTAKVPAKPVSATVLAQNFDQDIIGDLGSALNTFVESGQIWALIIGFVLGYLLRGVTTYK